MGILNGLFKGNCNGNVGGETTDNNGDSLLFFFLLLVILFCNCGLFEDDSSLLFFFLLLVVLFCSGCGTSVYTTSYGQIKHLQMLDRCLSLGGVQPAVQTE